MQSDEPITFPDLPRTELDRALGDLVEQARKVLDTQGRLRALVRANGSVVSHLELSTVLRTIAESAVELVGARYGALGVIAEGGGLEQFIHVGMTDEDAARIGQLPEGHGLLGALIDDPQPIRLMAIDGDSRSAGFPAGHPPMSAFLGVPITVRDSVYGNLYLTDPVAGEFTEDDEQLVRALAANAAIAIDNARLFAETSANQAWSAAAAELTAALLGGDATEAMEELLSRVIPLANARDACVVEADADTPVENAQLRSVLEGEHPARLEDLGPVSTFPGWRPGPALVVPLDGERRTAVLVAREQGSLAFSTFDLERTVGFVRQASLAIELASTRADRQRMLLLEERARIARDLHDHVIQQIFGAGLELQSLGATVGPGPVADRIGGSVRALDDAIAQIRTVIFALSHPRETDDGLRNRLLDIVHDLGQALPEPATVSFSGPVDVIADAALADDVAAFVREGLSNVVRHAHATTASIAVHATPDELTVTLSDDGRGIGESTRRSGLDNIAVRARLRAGSLTLDSSPGGTTLRLRLPVPQEDDR